MSRFVNSSYKKGAINSSLLSVLAKITALCQQLLIAYFFGANTGTDIYFYLLNVTYLLTGTLQSICTSVLIPHAMLVRSNKSQYENILYLNSFLCLLVLTFGVLFLLLAFLGVDFMAVITKFSIPEITSNISIFYLFLVATLLMLLNVFLAEVLVSYKYFTFSVLTSLIVNLGIIIFILLFYNTLGVASMFIGICCFSFLNSIFYIYVMKRNIGWIFFCFDIKSLNSSYKNILAIIGNQSIVVIASTFPFYLLSSLQPGVITIVNYAIKLTQAPFAVINQATAVLQIKLNELYSSNKFKELYALTRKICAYMLAIGLLIALVIFLCKDIIGYLLYRLTHEMSLDMIAQFSEVLGLYVFGLPFSAFSIIITKLYFAQQYIKDYVIIMFSINLLSCIIYFILITKFESVGYGLSFIIIEVITSILLGYKILSSEKKYNN